ncbi:hypothetical protein DWX73_12895 [Coprococcus sp. AF21-14LB]|nr:hypothetical protein DWX73_12895 [Coprococcus sp. AF21-14LB]
MKRTISFMTGKGSLNHNSRKFHAKNTDPNRTHWNVEYCNEDIKDVYHELFDDALKRYNDKQTRKDRKIDDYYEKIRSGKQEKLFHEVILQIGDKDNMGSETMEGQLAAKILDEYMKGFQERNPTLRVFAAHLHLDEATPHLHIDFIPYVTGSKRGLDTRVSLKQALSSLGFKGGSRSETELNQWVQSEKEKLAMVMRENEIEWDQKGTHEPHLSVLDYKKKVREQEVEELTEHKNLLEHDLHDISECVDEIQKEKEQAEKERDAVIKRVEKNNKREQEKKYIQDTIAQNRRGERKGTVIMPERKIYAFQDAKKIRVGAYCRVSTAEEAQVGSFEMQVQHFKSVIENNPNYELVKIYSDEGVSGTSVERRKGFQEMMTDAEKGKLDLILTKSISRFGRNIVDILTALRKLSNLSPPVAVNFESEGINTSDGKNKLVISILSALAELESQQKSIAIKEGIRYRMQEGLYKFSVHNTIGYYRDYSGRIKIEPAEAKIAQYIYECFLEGGSPQEIADFLTEQGIRSPKNMEYWKSATVRSILSNEKYCGNVLYQKTYSKDYLTHKTVKNNEVLPQYFWENNHPAIINKKTWDKAQELLSSGKYGKNKKQIVKLNKKFTVSKVKNGVLRGFILIDTSWTKEERDIVIKILENKELD